MSTTPVFEIQLEPKDPKASIVHIWVRVDDPVNIYDTDTCHTFIEKQFPMYNVAHIISGYKKVTE